MDRADRGGVERRRRTLIPQAIARAREWIEGLQSRDGAWAAFDADNTYHYLNHIPFADHGALLDPPTADVTARCVSLLAQLGETRETSAVLARGIDALIGRSGGGRKLVRPLGHELHLRDLVGALRAGRGRRRSAIGADAPRRRLARPRSRIRTAAGARAARATGSITRSYEASPSTASQTAWALLGLMAAGEADHPAVARGVAYLAATQGEDGFWNEPFHTATGFPRVFYLRYHGYSKFFPLWALARYRNLKRGNSRARGVRHVSARRRAFRQAMIGASSNSAPPWNAGALLVAIRSYML